MGRPTEKAPEIADVDAGVVNRSRDFGWLAGRQLLLLRGDALDEALRRLEPEGLTRAVAESRQLLTVPSPEVAELVRQDPAGLLTLLQSTLAGAEMQPGAGRDARRLRDRGRSYAGRHGTPSTTSIRL